MIFSPHHRITAKYSVFCALLAVFFVCPFPHSNAVAAPQLLHPFPQSPMFPKSPMAKDFELSDLDGENHKLSAYRGKVVLVNFWATWCPPCRKEIPSMQRAWEILRKKDVVMLAVHVGGNDDKVWSFLNDFEVDFPVLMDKSSKVSKAWPIQGLPVTFIVGPKGHLRLIAIGAREWDNPQLIKQILAPKK